MSDMYFHGIYGGKWRYLFLRTRSVSFILPRIRTDSVRNSTVNICTLISITDCDTKFHVYKTIWR